MRASTLNVRSDADVRVVARAGGSAALDVQQQNSGASKGRSAWDARCSSSILSTKKANHLGRARVVPVGHQHRPDGSSDCTCSVCKGRGPQLLGAADHYYVQDYPLWIRIQCFIAGVEDMVYDMSACVAAVVDEGAVFCVDELYENPALDWFDCEESSLFESAIEYYDECEWDDEIRLAPEMFADGFPVALVVMGLWGRLSPR